jgi:hypothetical protein
VKERNKVEGVTCIGGSITGSIEFMKKKVSRSSNHINCSLLQALWYILQYDFEFVLHRAFGEWQYDGKPSSQNGHFHSVTAIGSTPS